MVGAVHQRPAPVGALRVLLGETGAHATWVTVDSTALRGVPVVPVLRVGEGLPDDATWRELIRRAEALGASGVRVSQVEVDADVPTQALGAYVQWLQRTHTHFKRSITALPTWVGAPELPALIAEVDEVVLQVHTIRAPVLFDAPQALLDVHRWARVSLHPFRVSLPAYRMQLAEGEALAADPAEVQRTMQQLALEPLVSGLVFFRLGNAEDHGAWSLATLAAVLNGDALFAHTTPRLAPIDAGGGDIWLDNLGSVDSRAPTTIAVEGAVENLLATTGYALAGASLTTTTALWLHPGEHIRIGAVRGKNLHVSAP